MITVEFENLEEMRTFARELLGEQKTTAPVQDITVPPVMPVPVQAPVQAAPVATAPIAAQAMAPEQPVAPTVPVTAPVQQPPVTSPVPTSTQGYVLDDLARAAITLMDSGRQNDLVNLLAQFGVDSLPALPKEQYGAFATALRGMGAQI